MQDLVVKNLFYIVFPYLLITLVLGALINGFFIAAYVFLIPLSVIGSAILNYHLIKNQISNKRWLVIIGLAIVVGLFNYFLLWAFLELKFPFQFNP
jgi:hypothetical protein